MYQTFIVGKQPPIYEPHKFRNFCFSSGAPTLFDTILAAVTSSRHSQKRVQLNEKRVVNFIYKMCYCLSQQCNTIQVDHALYLHSNRINQEGIDTENRMGNTCCRRTMDATLNLLAKQSLQRLNSFLLEALQNEWLLVLIIDDYTNVHTHRRPKGNHPSSAVSMCTIVVKAFKNVNAIRCPSNIVNLHDEWGVDISSCKQDICSDNQLYQIANTYASTMPDWMVTEFFQPESERQRLSVHEYCESTSVRTMRRMDNLHLVDFVELQLKSKENFKQAFDIVLNTNLKLYMEKFILLQPGDWPCQFFSRQLVYEHVTHYIQLMTTIEQQQNMEIANGKSTHDQHCLTLNPPMSYQITSVPPMASVIPIIGPLHISLNSKEHVLLSFHPFFKNAYQYLFPSSKFPEKPKPWCISLLLELLYGGWTLIRDTTREVYAECKDLQYGTLLNLLDNYIPLVLSIYPVTFKSNRFTEYFNGIIRIWIMFTCLKRRHYNKATLVWIANILHWKRSYPDLYNLFKNWLTVSDEYPVENTHSVIRAQTKHSDTAAILTRKVKSIFQSKAKQVNFRSIFTPPKQFSFSHGQLKYLKLKCSGFLANVLSGIRNNPSNTTFHLSKKKNQRKLTVTMPEVFGKKQMNEIVLPLGYHGERPPDEDMKCDLPSCKVKSGESSILQGCWHSFHDECLGGLTHCSLCKKTLEKKIDELGKVAKDGIFNGKSNVVNDREEMPDTEQDDDEDNDSGGLNDVPNVDEQYIKEAITSINRTINSLKRSVPVGTNSLSHAEDECHTANHQSKTPGIVDTNNNALDKCNTGTANNHSTTPVMQPLNGKAPKESLTTPNYQVPVQNNPYTSCSDSSLSATNNQQIDGITVLKKIILELLNGSYQAIYPSHKSLMHFMEVMPAPLFQF